MDWWRPALNPEGLSQGDILSGILVGSPNEPKAFLGRDKWSNRGREYWPQVPELDTYRTDGTGLYVSRGKRCYGLVLSHSCEIDKNKDRGRVLVALVSPIEQVSDVKVREGILAQKRRAFMPLPDVPGVGTCYADLRQINFVAQNSLSENDRMASISDDGLVRLHAQLVAFFTRVDFNTLSKAV